MKILSSSPYATFNPKEWNSLSRLNTKFSASPIKIKKNYFCTFRKMKSSKTNQNNNELPKHIQLAIV